MGRLIDADALKAQIQREIDIYFNEVGGGIHTAMEACDEIDFAPTVDAIPVIRCKDCIKKELCSIFRDAKQELGFCAWAGRKEERRSN